MGADQCQADATKPRSIEGIVVEVLPHHIVLYVFSRITSIYDDTSLAERRSVRLEEPVAKQAKRRAWASVSK